MTHSRSAKRLFATVSVALLLGALLGPGCACGQDRTPEAKAAALVAKMTLAEKVGQVQSSAPAIPRLHVAAYDWWSEGLHGIARDGYATVFPQAIGLAASWDAGLLQQVGTTVSTEARAKFNAAGAGRDHARFQGLTIWSPNINIFRDPRWGRGQETYGEDPFLTGQLAVHFIRGIQGDDPQHPRAVATPKHLVVHSGPEAGRHGFDVDVSPHDLEATYLPAFRAAISEGQADSVMCAYNALHGTPVCANADLLTTRLRKDWGFKGFVVSDCDAVDDETKFHYFKPDNAQSSAASLEAGTDLDCGNAYADLLEAVRKGYVPEAAIDTALVRLFAARYRLGEWGGGEDRYGGIGPDQVDTAAHRQLALQAALESMVLLKNEQHVLPLRAGARLAVIGPNADALESLEANYHGTARAPITPLAGLRERFGADHIQYAQGAALAQGVPIPVPETALRSQAGSAGLTGEYFANLDFSGKPALTRTDRVIDFDWDHAAPIEGAQAAPYAVRWSGEWLPPAAGDYTLAVHVDRCFDCNQQHDRVRLLIDGRAVLEDSGDGTHTQAVLHAADTRPHAIRLEYIHSGQDQGVRLQWLAPGDAQLAQAQAVARDADAIVAFVGLSPDVEGEELQIDVPGFYGGDRTDIGLPHAQQALLERAAASGKPLVVVLMSGSAVALNWAQQHASAILAAWYPGEQGGRAVAKVLAGDYNPGGRLPVTFYRSTRDLPPFVSYAMQGRTYRYFTGTPLYPFGYGLSYTRFSYAEPLTSAAKLQAGKTLTVSAVVRNDGDREGDEVVQVYLQAPDDALAPRHQLVGFQRVHLAAHASRRVSFELAPRQLSSVDASGERAVKAGHYRLFLGGGQPGDADGVTAAFTIEGQMALPR
jgi:beta-glucosidase